MGRQSANILGLTFGVPAGANNATLLALGRKNADLIGAATYEALRIGSKGLTLPQGALVLAQQSAGPYAGRQPLYVAGADGFIWELDGTHMLMAGTDRTTIAGVAQFEGCTGVNGFAGSGSLNYLHPQFMSGVVSRVLDEFRFIVTLDAAITWSDFVQCVVYDASLDRYAARPCYSVPTKASQVGIPIARATGGDQATGYDYIVDCSTAATAAYDRKLVSPGVELVFMHHNGANAISGVDAEKIVLPSGLRIHAAPNAIFYGVATSLDAQCHCEAELFTSAIRTRGRFRRRMMASGGFAFSPSELSSNLDATIIGVGDDGIDVAAFTTGIVSATGLRDILVKGRSPAMPRAGQRVSLLDGNRQERAVMVVSDVALAGDDTKLTFNSSLPPGIDTKWAISPVTTSRGVFFKSGCRIQLTASAGLRVSQQSVHIENLAIGETMGPAIEFSDAGATEYAPLKTLSANALSLRNANSGAGFEPIAALVILPRKSDDSAYLGAGAFGEVRIGMLDVSGTSNGPAIAAGGLERFVLGSLTAEGLNKSPTSLAGQPTGCSIFLENIAFAQIDSLNEIGKLNRSIISCVGVDTLILGEACGAIPPESGVRRLIAYGKWLDFTPSFKASAGAFRHGADPTTANGCRWRLDRNRTWHMEGRIDLPIDLGSARGPLAMSLPVKAAHGGWEPGVIYDEAHRAGQWSISVAQGSQSATIYQLGHADSLVPGAALFFSLGGEAAP